MKDSVPDRWSETPWQQQGQDFPVPMWHKPQVPYSSLPGRLQHVDVWVPATSTSQSDTPSPSWLPPSSSLWVIYVHGGAWRDPLITSDSLVPALKRLPRELFESAGPKAPTAFASVSYSLSPYPEHPTLPSKPSDYSRNATHPGHILDVMAAISFLQQTAGFGSNYILAGHSCGATLAFQVAMNTARWGVGPAKAYIRPPASILGLNGIYDLPGLVDGPGEKHEHLRPIYEQFTRNAFGKDRGLWAFISPALVQDWAAEWPGGRHAILVQTREDSLIPFSQGEQLRDSLVRSGTGKLRVELLEGYGDHDETWENGTLLASMISRAIYSVIETTEK
ncbi:uncharacterized protein UV8b_05337 [Ustilaginoidea virens]|uniref:Kynurenine formamidase n=1 Tax=Ustilaginoidea virens TaxID=1159556 RepID=A0A063C5G9_USTVR|nr:uncharacterized protein UV8b_05337 [Ustilaginoidea virens]QUC21094.1 hypothetical protein UV8b_05337 [Ustilaginoidea virens]GAO14598.1 hypothetical protein UVI_02009490 [Ustilaginoidea virens]